jgi:predicted DNA-binding transcriptional regulator AlpA
MSSQYYTAGEARAKLGLSKSMFFRMVKDGLIPKVVLPGMTQGVYPKRDIDALALSTNSKIEGFVFARSTPADQLEEMNIGIGCFGREFIIPLAERIAFQQKCDFTFHSLKVHAKVVGYISMFRFPRDFLDDLLSGHRIEGEISVREVQPFVRLMAFEIYVDVIAVDCTLPLHLRRFYGGIIIFHFMDVIHNLIANDYQITSIYTVTTTKEGQRLAEKIGFRQMKGKSIVLGRIAYEYRLDDEGIQRLQTFQQRFRRHLGIYFKTRVS